MEDPYELAITDDEIELDGSVVVTIYLPADWPLYTGYNLQYPTSKKRWLLFFLRRVEGGCVYRYRNIIHLLFALCNAYEGTYHPNIICY